VGAAGSFPTQELKGDANELAECTQHRPDAGGALICVQTLVAVLERSARPTSVDPAFYAEVQQAQQSARGARSFDLGHRPVEPSAAVRSP
jgi:hypothetical protein